jgi:GAF domain-containing protein
LESTVDGTVRIVESAVLTALLDDDDAHIVDAVAISGWPRLTPLQLTSAIAAPLHTSKQNYLLLICNKQVEEYPFLAADRTVLDFLLAVIAADLRAEERLQREHEAVQQISSLVANNQTDELWRVIAQSATRLANTKYAHIYSYEADRHRLVSKCNWNAAMEAEIEREHELRLDEESLNTHVAVGHASAYIADLTKKSVIPFQTEKWEGDVQSAYCIPLISRDELVGTLYVAATAPQAISAEDRQALNRLAPHAAVALNTARLFQQIRRNLELDELIITMQQQMADVLQQTHQVEQIYSVLAPHFPQSLNLFLAVWDEHHQFIRLPIIHEQGERQNPQVTPLYGPRVPGERQGLIDYMISHQQELLDIQDFRSWGDAHQIEPAFQSGLRSCLVITLKHGAHVVGWLGFRGYDSAYMFTDRQRELLRRMAPHIATVLYNSQLYDQKIKEREVVSQFQTQISELNETEAAEINQISQAVRDALEKLDLTTTDMYIALLDAEQAILHIPLVYVNGHLLSEEERAKDPLYRTRPRYTRRGFTEHILQTDAPVLVRNRRELEAWQQRGLEVLPSHFCSWIGVPMRVMGRTIGVMALRSTTIENLFEQNHVELLQTVANQAAITLQNARQYEEARTTLRYNEVLYETSRSLSRAGVKEAEILETIVQQAMETTGSHLSVLYRRDNSRLQLQIINPPALRSKFYEFIEPTDGTIINRALRTHRAQLVADVARDPDYVDILKGQTGAQLAVVVHAGAATEGEALGIISIEHPKINGLAERERRFVIALANLAAIAMQNAERIRALQRHNVVAIMGAWGAEIMHTINRRVGEIRTTLFAVLLANEFSDETRQMLQNIDFIAESMLLREFHRSKSSGVSLDGNQDSTVLDETLQSEINHYRVGDRVETPQAQVKFTPGCMGLKVKIHERWLRILINHYLSNAARHLLPTAQQITVWTERQGDQAVIYVENVGQGIAEEIRPLLFEEPIEPTEQTSGRGLLLVRFICEHHHGHAWLASTANDVQTRFAFSVPVSDA